MYTKYSLYFRGNTRMYTCIGHMCVHVYVHVYAAWQLCNHTVYIVYMTIPTLLEYYTWLLYVHVQKHVCTLCMTLDLIDQHETHTVALLVLLMYSQMYLHSYAQVLFPIAFAGSSC